MHIDRCSYALDDPTINVEIYASYLLQGGETVHPARADGNWAEADLRARPHLARMENWVYNHAGWWFGT